MNGVTKPRKPRIGLCDTHTFASCYDCNDVVFIPDLTLHHRIGSTPIAGIKPPGIRSDEMKASLTDASQRAG